MELLGDVGHVESPFFLFGDTIGSEIVGWCTVCVERTIGLEIVLDSPDGILGDVVHMESCFFLFGDSVSVGERWVHGLH
jgi:hypothetical protein